MSADHHHPLRRSEQDRVAAEDTPQTPQTLSPAYRLAYSDEEFLLREDMRPVRLQLELRKPEVLMNEAGVESTIVMFGGARIPEPARKAEARTETLAELSAHYAEAREFARLMTLSSMERSGGREGVIVTGGGPGVMEAGNRGAADAGGRSVGLGIVLPHEQAPNAYVTPELSFNFHYFAIRKMHFLMRAKALCVFPGGFGTLDELFETLTLIQTGRMEEIPVLLFGRAFWEEIIDWQALARAGTISDADLDLFRYVETAQEAVEAIEAWDRYGERRGEIPGRA
ncbi:MAG: TIGR00730 family Rossman fold protein [Rhodobacterales bacterium]|nr:MAG: TIGR00730 family Rossman fold protein [Rhodobacterales bacterium]